MHAVAIVLTRVTLVVCAEEKRFAKIIRKFFKHQMKQTAEREKEKKQKIIV